MSEVHLIIDTANLFFRVRHVVRGSAEDKVGMSLQTVFSSVRKAWRQFNATHVVACFEGRSWRKDHYEPYKRNRSEARAAQTVSEQEEDQLFWETFDDFKEYLTNKTNVSALQNPQLEADDLIGGWIQAHPDAYHIIISTDGDFAQLISPTVKQYNGVSGVTITHEGYFDERNKRVFDKKTKMIKPPPEPEWQLFEKCMRGDKSDNIFSAYPGVREYGTKNKIGMREAFDDRNSKGYAWNNLMLQKWVDHNGTEHRVMDDYARNKLLCDLTAQPPEIKLIIQNTIAEEIAKCKNVPQVGTHLLKLCAKHDLPKISEQIQSFATPLNARYSK